jgi:hypothetical protein
MHLDLVHMVRVKSSLFSFIFHFSTPCCRASELLVVEEKKGHGSGAGKSESKNGVRPEDYELILSDPLLKDGFMCWPLCKFNTVGFVPGMLFVRALFQQVTNFLCDSFRWVAVSSLDVFR